MKPAHKSRVPSTSTTLRPLTARELTTARGGDDAGASSVHFDVGNGGIARWARP